MMINKEKIAKLPTCMRLSKSRDFGEKLWNKFQTGFAVTLKAVWKVLDIDFTLRNQTRVNLRARLESK